MSLPTTRKSLDTARIIIIGAGPAGIAAATRLLEANFKNVIVLEAENRIGGRIYTIPYADNVLDLGAQWCHGEEKNVIYERVKDLNVLQDTDKIYDDFICVRSNREIVEESVSDVFKTIAFNSITDRQTDLIGYEGSLGAYLTEKYWKDLKKHPEIDHTLAEEFLECFKKFESSVEGSDTVFEVSGQGHLQYWLCEGELLLNWKDKGFKSYLNLLLKAKPDVPNDLGILNKRVLFNKYVEHIDYSKKDNGEVHIKCWDGELMSADHVICTTSLGVLKENYKKMFTPTLPLAKCRAIEGLKFGTVGKFFMEFNEAFGGVEHPTGFNFLWLEKDLADLKNSNYFWLESVFGFYHVSCQPRLLQGWIVGPHARHMETLPEEEVKTALLWLFRKFFTFPIPEPINFIRTQWYTNSNFRGSYSFRSTYTDELRTGAWDLEAPLSDDMGKPLLQFAGEATHRHYYSTVHGAVESGYREAQRLIAFYDDGSAHL